MKSGEKLKLPYAQQGIKIMSSGINLVYEIPVLNVVVTFGMTGFSVNLPYQYFGSNTQGHCGKKSLSNLYFGQSLGLTLTVTV